MERYVRRYPIKGKENEFLDVDVYYSKGDIFDSRRGYWMSWCPVTITHADGLVSVGIEPYKGTRYFVIPLKRNSKNAYNQAKQKLVELADRLIQLSGYDVEDTYEEEEF